jgi:hypothetical protein
MHLGVLRAIGPKGWSQVVFGTEVMRPPPQATMMSATGTVTGIQSHGVMAVLDLGWCWAKALLRVFPPWLPPFRDSQISESGAEKRFGHQVKYEEYESVER